MLSYEWVHHSDHGLIPTVRELFEEYSNELGIDLCFQGFSEELASLPGKYAPPKGGLVVVLDTETPIACGALRELEPDLAELKRIYVRPDHRGRGLGLAITLALMDRARTLGYQRVRLDTLRRLAPAVRLYSSLGFTEIEPYNFNPEPDIVYMERQL